MIITTLRVVINLPITEESLNAMWQPKQEKGFLSRAWDDVSQAAGDFATGAQQAWDEVGRENTAVNDLYEKDENGAFATDENGNAILKDGVSEDYESESLALRNKAVKDYNEQIGSTAGTTALSILVPQVGIPTTIAYMAGKGYEKDGIGGAIKEAWYGPLEDWYNQPDLGQQFHDRPITTTASGILGAGMMALPALAFLKGFSGVRGRFKGRTPVEGDAEISPYLQKVIESDQEKAPAEMETAPSEYARSVVEKGTEDAYETMDKPDTGYEPNDSWMMKDNNIDIGEVPAVADKDIVGAPIRLSERNFDHIAERRGEDIVKAGYPDVETFVQDVIENYGEIRDNQKGRLLLVKRGDQRHGVASVELELSKGQEGDFYSVITAFPVRKAGEGYINKRELLSERGPNRPPQTDPGAATEGTRFQRVGDESQGIRDNNSSSTNILQRSTKQVNPLEEQSFQAAIKGRFDEAVRLAKQSGNANLLESMKQARALNAAGFHVRPGEQYSLPSRTVPMESTYSKPVTRQEITRDINKLVASRTGKIGNAAADGVFKMRSEVIRTENFGDFDVHAHELGHFADKKLGIQGHDAELIGAADRTWGGNKMYDGYNQAQRRAEGVAEFTRQYLMNPSEAKRNFPGYYEDFSKALAGDKKLATALDNIGNKIRAWYAQTPEARGRGSITFGGDDHTTIFEKAREKAYKWYENMIDDKFGLSRLTSAIEKSIGENLTYEQNPYKRARMAQNSATARSEMLIADDNPAMVTETLNRLYGGKLQYEVTLKSIFDSIKNLSEKYPDYLKNGNFKNWNQALANYLTAKRQLEIQGINKEYRGPLSEVDAKAIVKNSPKELEAAAQQFYNYHDNMLSIAEDGGLISAETAKLLREKYQNYSPMLRDMADEEAMATAFGNSKRLGNIGNPLKALSEEGSTRDVIDPLEATIKNTFTLLSAVERNKVAQVFVKLDEDFADLGRFVEEIPGGAADKNKSIFTVMVDGEKKAFQTEPEFYRAIMAMNQQSSNAVIALFRPFAKALRTGATCAPDFIIRNMIRDTLTAGIYSDIGFKPVLDTLRGAKDVMKNDKLAYEFKASGAPMSVFVGLDRPELAAYLAEVSGTGWRNVPAAKVGLSIFEGMRKASELGESATRMGEFSRARAQGRSIDEAGLMAKDITLDFSRSGTITRQVNQVVPFFNAVLQGGDRFARAMISDPKKTTLLATIYITLPSVALWIINHDKEWYQQEKDDVKNSAWLIDVGTDHPLKIPKPFEPGIFFGSAPERVLDYLAGEDRDAMKQWAKYAAQGFAPSIMPTVAGPIIEWITNYNMFRGKAIVGQKEDKLPNEYQFTPYTTELAKGIGSLTGQSPMKIDNTIAGYLGGAGTFISGFFDNFIGEKNNPAKDIEELPGVRNLTITKLKNPKSVDEFYDKLEDVTKEQNAKGKGSARTAEYNRMMNASKQIQDLNKKNRDITADPNMDPQEKRRRIDVNSQRILGIAKNAIQ